MNIKNILVCFLMLVLIAPIFVSAAKADQCEKNKEKLLQYHDLADKYCESLYPNSKLCSKYTKLVAVYKERVVTNCDISCKDTDNRDYYTKGFMQAGLYDSGHWDSCYDDYLLVEYYCENNEGRKEAIQCASGCQDGACLYGECDSHKLSIGEISNNDGKIAASYKIVGEDNVNAELMIVTEVPIPEPPEEPEVPEPVEEPIDPSSPTGGGGGGGGSPTSISCPIIGGFCGAGSGSDVMYCKVYTQCDYPEYTPNTRYYLKLIDETCPGVYDTKEITPFPSCTDSDGGINYYVKGTVSGISLGGLSYIYSDFCNGDIIGEWYCDGTSPKAETTYVCPNGCQDGACVETSQLLFGVYDKAPASDVILVSDFVLTLKQEGYETGYTRLFSEIDSTDLDYTEFTILAYLGEVVVIEGAAVAKDENLYTLIVNYLNNNGIEYRIISSDQVQSPNLLGLFETYCSDHELFFTNVENNNGKIRISYSYRNVESSDIYVSYHSSGPYGGGSMVCNRVGAVGCGGGSGSPYVTCTANTDCDYPEEILPETDYYVVIEDTACSLSDTFVIEPTQVVIEEDIPPLLFIGTLHDDDCGLIQDNNCDVYVAQYELPTSGVELVNVGVEIHHGGLSNEQFIEAAYNIAQIENMQIDEETYLGENFYVLEGSEGELKDIIVLWYNDNRLVVILIHNWNIDMAGDDFIENLFIAYINKYPSDLEFTPICTDSDGGQNWYTKGQTYGLEAPNILDTFTDYCGTAGDEAGKLVEYVCQPNDYVQKVLYSCPNSCQDGKCIT